MQRLAMYLSVLKGPYAAILEPPMGLARFQPQVLRAHLVAHRGVIKPDITPPRALARRNIPNRGRRGSLPVAHCRHLGKIRLERHMIVRRLRNSWQCETSPRKGWAHLSSKDISMSLQALLRKTFYSHAKSRWHYAQNRLCM